MEEWDDIIIGSPNCGKPIVMRRFIARLFCRHTYDHWLRNIYGDEINSVGGKRSEWQCSKCGAYKYKDELYRNGA